ncbi:MAG: hypothetical protein PWP23_1362 [Candidatus Sumerlaeota bacterium]|nr:hypothetical protein [Candidatus Sumerlaeota bacterium]
MTEPRTGWMERHVGGWPVRAALLMAIGLSAFYWLLPSRRVEAQRVWQLFYAPLRHQGLSLDGSHVPRHLESGEFSEWTHLLARGALIRWHVRETAPHALSSLETRWEDGLWTPPDSAELRAALEALDASWAARCEAAGEPLAASFGELAQAGWEITVLAGGEPLPHRLGEQGELIIEDAPAGTMLRLTPPEGIPTEQFGDRLILEFDPASAEEGRLYRTVLYFHVNNLPESGFRRHLAEFPEDAAPATRAAFSLHNEPAWLAEGARLRSLRIDFPNANGRLVLHGLSGGNAAPQP